MFSQSQSKYVSLAEKPGSLANIQAQAKTHVAVASYKMNAAVCDTANYVAEKAVSIGESAAKMTGSVSASFPEKKDMDDTTTELSSDDQASSSFGDEPELSPVKDDAPFTKNEDSSNSVTESESSASEAYEPESTDNEVTQRESISAEKTQSPVMFLDLAQMTGIIFMLGLALAQIDLFSVTSALRSITSPVYSYIKNLDWSVLAHNITGVPSIFDTVPQESIVHTNEVPTIDMHEVGLRMTGAAM